MTNNEPQVMPTARYGVTEAAAILGVSRSTINRHVQAGTLKFKLRKANCRKYFTGIELLRFWNASY